jgi:GH18 family chitinase
MKDIPINSLTHLYFSFAFITPNEYNIVGMDGLPSELFSNFTDLKKDNPSLKMIIAIGGWTHNDPGTYLAHLTCAAKKTNKAPQALCRRCLVTWSARRRTDRPSSRT